ncbi:hypothetical protein MXMO3_01731 [Maritalea myrionectae]|uniref:Uncharacterized protein n=1 Tax=Maritalea myrionectae TaxID=454601 RepID=A0A2R4MDZ8_9HYPH|nr:hypothetical protein [Maritalea myrionectae]AVX04257.1 hypothetical protein MXMO3_01731 [Maritalea myrionectae]
MKWLIGALMALFLCLPASAQSCLTFDAAVKNLRESGGEYLDLINTASYAKNMAGLLIYAFKGGVFMTPVVELDDGTLCVIPQPLRIAKKLETIDS